MPLSNAEKQKRYREKKIAQGQHDEMKAKERDCKQNNRKSLSAVDMKTLRRAERDRARESLWAIGTPNPTPKSPQLFNPQSLGKAVSRAVGHLPHNPRKRSKVIRTLVKRFEVDGVTSPPSSQAASTIMRSEFTVEKKSRHLESCIQKS